jgi:c-di-GMP-binding flagellar brake protein YcgR
MPAAPSSFITERRRHRRFGIERDGKVYSPDTRQYTPARTRDLSVGGAMLEVDAERPFSAGQRVDIAVASTTDGIIRNESMVQAVVVRADALRGKKQVIAVRYLGAERAHAAA